MRVGDACGQIAGTLRLAGPGDPPCSRRPRTARTAPEAIRACGRPRREAGPSWVGAPAREKPNAGAPGPGVVGPWEWFAASANASRKAVRGAPGGAPRTGPGQSRQVTLVAGPTRLAPDSHSTLPAPSTLTSFHSVSAPMGAVPDHTG